MTRPSPGKPCARTPADRRDRLRPPLVAFVISVLLASAAAATPGAGTGAADGADGSVLLDGDWELLLDAEDRGRDAGLQSPGHEAWSEALAIAVPGVLESLPETAGYDGIAWYRRTLPGMPPPAPPHDRVLLEFDNVNGRVDAWLDGHWLGRHDGSDERFHFDVSEHLARLAQPGASLVLRCVDPGVERVDDLVLGAWPHAKESWYLNYGGILGSVRLTPQRPVAWVHHDVVWNRELGEARARLSFENLTDAPRALRVTATITAAAPPAEPEPEPEPSRPTPDHTSRPRASIERLLTLPPGRSSHLFPFDSEGLAPWTPAAPVLHRLSVRMQTPAAEPGEAVPAHELQRPFGLRTFRVAGDHFELNGAPIYLRGVLYQPFFPATHALPPHPDFVRAELTAIKSAGFNLVRAHLRTDPHLFAVCDELGLLVHAEPTLGWITEVRRDTAAMVDRALVAFADDVAGHPSVVMLGLLNELSGQLHRRSRELLLRTHALLPERLLLEDSGSWQGDSHYLNPFADEPVPFDDLHVYRSWPWNEGDLRYIDELGADSERLVFVSEYGFGGIPSLEDNLAGFADRPHLEDAAIYRDQLADVQAQLATSASAPLAPAVSALVALGQDNQARAARFMAATLRAHPRVAGDVYTQWRDVCWENGAGLVDVWGTPKPALDVFTALNALPERTPPEPVRSVVPRPGSLFDAPPPVREMIALEPEFVQRAFPVAPSSWLERLGRLLASPTAVVGFRANMWGPEEIDTTLSLLHWVRDGGTALFIAPPTAGRPLPQDMFGYDTYGAVTDLPFDARVRTARGHFVGAHSVFAEGSALLDGFVGDSRLLDERFADVRPDQALLVRGVDGLQIELGNFDGYGLDSGAIVQSVPYGRGHIVLSTLLFDPERMTPNSWKSIEPASPSYRLWTNLLAYATAIAEAGPPAPPRRPVKVPDDVATAVGRLLWRHKIYFGLAERLAMQRFNGSRPVRRELDDLQAVIDNKNRALELILDGSYDEGVQRLGRIETGPLQGDRDAFLRAEIGLADRYGKLDFRPDLPSRLRLGELHARALSVMRDGQPKRALAFLAAAAGVVEQIERAGPPPDAGPSTDDQPLPDAGDREEH